MRRISAKFSGLSPRARNRTRTGWPKKAGIGGSSSSRDRSSAIIALCSPGSSLEPSGQKIPFHRQLADLGVEIANLGFVILALVIRAVRKQFRKTINHLALPRAHPVRMNLVL
ncbi:MAG TPA: hypothetical protein VIJ42_07710 [Stellaceae bacterium]